MNFGYDGLSHSSCEDYHNKVTLRDWRSRHVAIDYHSFQGIYIELSSYLPSTAITGRVIGIDVSLLYLPYLEGACPEIFAISISQRFFDLK